MRVTLKSLKEILQSQAPAGDLEYRVNRVIERLITGGKWDGVLQPISLVARWGVVTLPPNFRTIEGGKIGGIVRDVTARYFDYLPGKSDNYDAIGEYFRDSGDNYATLYPLPLGGRGYTGPPTATITGDGTGAIVIPEVKDGAVTGCRIINQGSGYTFATIAFTNLSGVTGAGAAAVVGIENGVVATITMTVGGTFKLTYPGTDPSVVTIYGTDANFMPLSLTISGNNTVVANPFIRIDRINRDPGVSVFTLVHTSISGDTTPVMIMAPSETETFYRRYIVDSLTTKPVQVVSVLAKLRHVEFTNDNDIVPISNIYALEQGLRAYQYDAEGDKTLAGQYWKSAIDALNDELNDMMSPDQIPNIRFHRIGGDVKLRSHY